MSFNEPSMTGLKSIANNKRNISQFLVSSHFDVKIYMYLIL